MSENTSTRSAWIALAVTLAATAVAMLIDRTVFELINAPNVYASDFGKLLRVIETNRAYVASNGIAGHGGAIDVAGVLVSGGQVIVPSGYAPFGQMPGNMLLVYELAGPTK